MAEPLLAIRELRIAFGRREPVEVVHGIDLDLTAGEVLAVVGESGSGKSVTAMSVLGLLPDSARVTGSIQFDGRELLGLSGAELRRVRGGDIAMVFQDPVAALNPVFTVGFQLIEAVRAHDRRLSASAARKRAIELLDLVEIPDPGRRLRQYPHEFSGGMCQRVVIAMALAAEPRLLIADEPTGQLDTETGLAVMALIRGIVESEGMTAIVSTHDPVMIALADTVLRLEDGRIVDG